MRIAITGSSGLIGSALVPALEGEGHEVTRVVRRRGEGDRPGTVAWDPAGGWIDRAGLEGHDLVIHLAAESIAGLWTRRKRARIVESRVGGTSLLSETLAKLERPPRALFSASAVGYYGDRPPGEVVEEGASPGRGFLADTVVAWEEATRAASAAGIRVVHLRFGIVLSFRGGMLGAILPLFRAGLGARLGRGEQSMSWVALSEVPHLVGHLVEREEIEGPVNAVSPGVVTNAEFTSVLGRVLGRPTPFRVPAFLLRAVGGDQAEEMLLSGARVRPARLLGSGYDFRYPELESSLRHEREIARVARHAVST